MSPVRSVQNSSLPLNTKAMSEEAPGFAEESRQHLPTDSAKAPYFGAWWVVWERQRLLEVTGERHLWLTGACLEIDVTGVDTPAQRAGVRRARGMTGCHAGFEWRDAFDRL